MLSSNEITQIFEDFNNLKALIIGDVMIDAYYWGKVNRISPEAPVPIVSVTKKDERLGGAANVALNVRALGADPILCSVVGSDEKSGTFQKLLKDQQMTDAGIVKSSNRVTTVKTRFLGGGQQILRVDEEDIHPLEADDTQLMLDRVRELVDTQKIDVIIFEDYDKGVITPDLIAGVVAIAKEKNIPTTVDPKKRNFLDYNDVTLFKPNLKELREGLKLDLEKADKSSLDEATRVLKERTNAAIALFTLSEEGVYIAGSGESMVIPAHLRRISDVSGAGDTVISVASLCLALGLDESHIAQWSNLAGGLVCEELGVVPVDKERLLKEALALTEA